MDGNFNTKGYRTSLAKTFNRLKELPSLEQVREEAITLESGAGFLLPVGNYHYQLADVIQTMAKWAKQKNHTFPVQFPVTMPGTLSWLSDRVLANPGRMLFLVTNQTGTLVGQVGFIDSLNDEGEMWLANILRGEDDLSPGIMTAAVQALMAWARQMFKPRRICLRVLSHNEHAIKFYNKLGFRRKGKAPYWIHQIDNRLEIFPHPPEASTPVDMFFDIMIHQGD
ncbi:MAG: GNAT family N-acetyltransferase [Desulfarculaceae bacterium]|jgi:RimJ/RimL family protein N-acetyltransferase